MFNRHIRDIKLGGLPALLRKSRLLLGLILGISLSALPLLIIRALRPLVIIRFGQLISHRIGPYVSEPEVYLSELEIGMHQGRFVDVFYHETHISNYQVKKMWNRALRVIQVARPVGRLNQWVPGGGIHQVPWRGYQQRDIYGALMRTATHLKFTKDENERGEAALQDLGVPKGASFVCFHARDSAYGESLATGIDIGRVDYRNSDIQTYLPAIEKLTQRGYYALRMGAVVEQPLTTDNPLIIDYATKARSELMDLYLSANCHFFIGSAVGITYLPMAFRRPTVYTNFVPIGVLIAWPHHDLCIPKKLWVEVEHRYMTLREIIQSGTGMFARSWQYAQDGIELVNSTPEEIETAVLEMDDRLSGVWKTTSEDENLQAKFWSCFDPEQVKLAPQARIGTEYLRRNPELLAQGKNGSFTNR